MKIVDATAGADPELRRTLVQEARIGAWLRHPNLVRIGGSGEHEGVMWIAMEWVDGQGLDELLRRGGPVPARIVVELLVQAAAGLGYVHTFAQAGHRLGLVHRDVKPANLLVDRRGRVLVTDFGIAKATEIVSENSVVKRGTPVYMSPEQAQGRPLDPRTDIWSLASVGWEALTGERLFASPSLIGVIMALVDADQELAERRVFDRVPTALRGAFEGALRQQPEARWAAMQDFSAALGGTLDALPAAPSLEAWVLNVLDSTVAS